jgi:tetratricopeptide (TPR) repeat protein
MQKNSIEELEAILSTEGSTRLRLETLVQLQQLIFTKDFPRSAAVCREIISLADALNDTFIMAEAHNDLGNALWKLGELSESQHHYTIGLELFTELQDDNGLGDAYCGLGIVHGSLVDSANALHFFELAAAAFKRANNLSNYAHNIGNIGHVYFELGDHTTANTYFERAIAISMEQGDKGKQGVANMLGAIAGVLVFQNRFEEGIEKLEQAMVIDREIGSSRGVTVNLMNIGLTYFKAGQHANAIAYLNRSLAYADKTHLGMFTPEIHKNLSEVYYAINDEAEALKHLQFYTDFQKAEKRSEAQRRAKEILGKNNYAKVPR